MGESSPPIAHFKIEEAKKTIMNKIIFPIATVAIVMSAIFIACKKTGPQEVSQPKQTVAEPNWQVSAKAAAQTKRPTLMHCPNGPCHTPAYDCVELEEVVIKAPKMHALIALGQQGSSSDVGAFFSNADNMELTANLDPSIKEKILSGQYYIGLNYNGDATCNFMFGKEFPVTSGASEFTIEYAKEQ